MSSRRIGVGGHRHDPDRHEREHDTRHRRSAGSFPTHEPHSDRQHRTDDRGDRRGEADQPAGHRGVEEDELDADGDAARQRQCDVSRAQVVREIPGAIGMAMPSPTTCEVAATTTGARRDVMPPRKSAPPIITAESSASSAVTRQRVAPTTAGASRAKAFLPFLARPALGDAACRLGAVGAFLYRRLAWRAARGPAVRSSTRTRSSAASRSSVTSCTSDPQCGHGVEALAGDEVATRRAYSDLAQRERRDHRRDDPDLDLGEGEHRPLVREHDVGAGDEPGAAAERVSLDERDDGSGADVDRLQHPAQGGRLGDVLVVGEVDGGAHPVDVCAGAKARPLAGEHHRARRADVHERLCELRDHRRVESVSCLGSRERDAEHVVVAFDADRAHGAIVGAGYIGPSSVQSPACSEARSQRR